MSSTQDRSGLPYPIGAAPQAVATAATMVGSGERRRATGGKIAWFAASLTLALCAGSGFALGPEGLTMITQAAERGADASQVLLAVAYLNGNQGLAQDPARAAYWFEQAAIQGNAYAEARLGNLYAHGIGVPANQTLAFDWRVKAAYRGEVEAQLEVGKMYQDGVGVGRDVDQAIYWYRRAATEGSAEASRLAGKLQRYGNDAEVTQAASRSLFEKAAKRGYELASYLVELVEDLGYRLDEGWHHRLPGLEELARDGDIEAAYQLGQRYERGVGGVRRDYASAIAWYRRAAEGQHPMAISALAGIHGAGLDSAARDPRQAARWAARTQAAAH